MLKSIPAFSGVSRRREAPKVPVRARRGAHAHPTLAVCRVCQTPSAGSGQDLVRSTPLPEFGGSCRQGSEPKWRLSGTTGPASVHVFRNSIPVGFTRPRNVVGDASLRSAFDETLLDQVWLDRALQRVGGPAAAARRQVSAGSDG